MSLQWWVNRSSRTGGQRKSNPGCLWPLVFSKDDRLLSVKNVAFRLTAPWESMANIDNPFHFLPVRFYGYLYYHCCSIYCIFSTNDVISAGQLHVKDALIIVFTNNTEAEFDKYARCTAEWKALLVISPLNEPGIESNSPFQQIMRCDSIVLQSDWPHSCPESDPHRCLYLVTLIPKVPWAVNYNSSDKWKDINFSSMKTH